MVNFDIGLLRNKNDVLFIKCLPLHTAADIKLSQAVLWCRFWHYQCQCTNVSLERSGYRLAKKDYADMVKHLARSKELARHCFRFL